MHDSDLDNPGSNGEAKLGTEAPEPERAEIMSQLPRSRPQRRNYRRPAGPAPEEATAETASPDASAEPGESNRPTPPAPGIPELTASGVYEIAKLPLKVGAHAAFRALDAVARSLRSR